MKSESFDGIARAMATAPTRRRLLAAFVGGMMASVLGSLLRPQVGQALQPCTGDSQCPKNERCAAGACVGAVVTYVTATPAPDPVVPAQHCLDDCHAAAVS